MVSTRPHAALRKLSASLQEVYDAILNYQPTRDTPPILDSSIDVGEDGQWIQNEHVIGLGKLRDSVKMDLDILGKFLDDPSCAHMPPLSTNAPYLIAVWNEVRCAPAPVEAVFKSMPLNGASFDNRHRGGQRLPGVKVDVVADGGKRWIRVNTVKNSRLLAEFREIDSYFTDSDDSSYEDSPDARPSLAQNEFDNSVLQMGRSLLAAAQSNKIEGTREIPQVTIRLTRLDPNADGKNSDPRIAKTVFMLKEMGINVELGERTDNKLPRTSERSRTPPLAVPLEPTRNINLDLSVLIALISDTSHSPLPPSIDEANKRYIPPPEYREWKQRKNEKAQNNRPETPRAQLEFEAIDDLPKDLRKQARALTNQLFHEIAKGLLQEMHDRISAMACAVKFWTTVEARERCLRIVSKIGGLNEKNRAKALFWTISSQPFTVAEAEEMYWSDSRHPAKFLPLFPINILPVASIPSVSLFLDEHAILPGSHFSRILAKTCQDILKQETIPHPRALPEELTTDRQTLYDAVEIQRAAVTKANPRLTAHTVQSLMWGAELGWTTLTANRTSVKAILREIKLAKLTGRLDAISGVDCNDTENQAAALWIVDPRSLAEGMSSVNHK